MPIGRILLKSISESKKMPRLKTDGARLLYSWLIPHLDINGCFSGDAEVIKGRVFTRLKKSTEIIEEYLQDLESIKLIVRYEIDGDIFLHSPDFVEKQPKLNPEREGKPTIPLPTPDLLQSYSKQTQELPRTSKVNLSKVNLIEEEREILTLLQKAKNYPFSSEKDLEFIQSLKSEFPDVNILEKVKQITTNWIDRPLVKKSRPRVQIRKWVSNESKWQKEGDKEKQIGESNYTPTEKDKQYEQAREVKLKELEKKYQPQIEKAKKAKNMDWLDNINNKIKEELAEFSQQYH